MAECWRRGVTLEPGSVQEYLVSSAIELEREEKMLLALLQAASGLGDLERTKATYDMLLRLYSTNVEKTRAIKDKLAERRLENALSSSLSLVKKDGRFVLREEK